MSMAKPRARTTPDFREGPVRASSESWNSLATSLSSSLLVTFEAPALTIFSICLRADCRGVGVFWEAFFSSGSLASESAWSCTTQRCKSPLSCTAVGWSWIREQNLRMSSWDISGAISARRFAAIARRAAGPGIWTGTLSPAASKLCRPGWSPERNRGNSGQVTTTKREASSASLRMAISSACAAGLVANS